MRTAWILGMMIAAAAGRAAEPEAPRKSPTPVRTLDSITIEGDVAVPQVLFITSREHPRHREDLGRALRVDALSLARGAEGPDRLVIIDGCVSRTIKEQ